MEVCTMLIDCCAQERTFQRFFALQGERLCRINQVYQEAFAECFVKQYQTVSARGAAWAKVSRGTRASRPPSCAVLSVCLGGVRRCIVWRPTSCATQPSSSHTSSTLVCQLVTEEALGVPLATHSVGLSYVCGRCGVVWWCCRCVAVDGSDSHPSDRGDHHLLLTNLHQDPLPGAVLFGLGWPGLICLAQHGTLCVWCVLSVCVLRQELSEHLGLAELDKRLQDPTMKQYYDVSNHSTPSSLLSMCRFALCVCAYHITCMPCYAGYLPDGSPEEHPVRHQLLHGHRSGGPHREAARGAADTADRNDENENENAGQGKVGWPNTITQTVDMTEPMCVQKEESSSSSSSSSSDSDSDSDSSKSSR